MIDFKNELNEEQYDVVKNGDGPCLVLAGAGSGKTRTIVYRVAYLLEQGVLEDNILLLTFTNKASREMLRRVENLVGKDIKKIPGGTFHKMGLEVLKKHAKLVDYSPSFSILDSEDSKDLMKLAMEEVGLTGSAKKTPAARLLHDINSFSVNADRGIGELVEERWPQWEHLSEDIQRAIDRYHERKRKANVMDFDDLLVLWRNLLRDHADVRKKLSEQFKYILVDEYQDTNKLQGEIVKYLSEVHKNILAVGDDAQSIYSFRAADINNILDFKQTYKDAKVFKLQVNYRSTKTILDLANSIIDQNKKQFKKKLTTPHTGGVAPELASPISQEEEAIHVANAIERALRMDTPHNEIAVLFRASHHSQMVEMELAKRGIRYDYRGGLRFFERAHVKDVLAYLRAIHNPKDEIAWRRVLTLYPGIGPATADAVYQLMKVGAEDKVAEVLSARAREGYGIFERAWNELKQVEKDPALLIAHLAEGAYRRVLEEKYEEPEMRLRDVEQMKVFAERSKSDLGKFLAEASLQENYASDMDKDKQENKKVIMSTIHQAKGLEWEHVHVINLVNGEFPNERALREEGGVEEERRLFYVAVTRAKKKLYISYPVMGGYVMNQPSPFVEEVSHLLAKGAGVQRFQSSYGSKSSADAGEPIYEFEDGAPFSTEAFSRSAAKPKKAGFLNSVEDL